MTWRVATLAGAVALGVIGLGMLGYAAFSPPGDPVSPISAPERTLADPKPSDGGARDITDPSPRSLERSRPREAAVPSGGASAGGGTSAPPAQTGESLPPQWAAFRPTSLTLGAGFAGSAEVAAVGVVEGQLSLPEDADRVGWWRDGARVGSPFGTAVVAGHLDSKTDPAGYLAGLAVLAEGDEVELADGTIHQRYRVVRNYLLPRADLSARSDLFEQDRPHRLLLITCGGPYDQGAGGYAFNRIVVAVPVS